MWATLTRQIYYRNQGPKIMEVKLDTSIQAHYRNQGPKIMEVKLDNSIQAHYRNLLGPKIMEVELDPVYNGLKLIQPPN
jgi:hypothetical protein